MIYAVYGVEYICKFGDLSEMGITEKVDEIVTVITELTFPTIGDDQCKEVYIVA